MIERPLGFHIMAKPIGPVCNLCCEYCYYTEKEALFQKKEDYRMSEEVLEAYIRKYIESQDLPEVPFIWQGGEPTLMGLEFFRKVIKLQNQYGRGKRITNSLQTNGILLNDEWCNFLARHHFLVGLSLDGPADVHDHYRVDRCVRPTFKAVIRGLKLMQKHGVEFNVLACVARENAKRSLDIYRFFKEQGVQFIQFIPVVERKPNVVAEKLGLRLSTPPDLDRGITDGSVTPWTVEPEAYGNFMIQVFDEWVRNDVGFVFVMNFEWALNAWMGGLSSMCFFAQCCGRSVVMEHNGDIYSCDHFVYPQYRLGNIVNDSPKEILDSVQQIAFGSAKETSLPQYCQECQVLFACHGGCPRHRFIVTPTDEPGLNYLCAGYKKFFRHIHKYMKVMVELLEHGLTASHIIKAIEAPANDFGR